MDKIYTTDREKFRAYTAPEEFEKIKPFSTVNDMWRARAGEYADSIAIEDDGKKYTYKQLEEDASYLRPVFANRGRIAILCPNSYDFVKAYLAAVTSGCNPSAAAAARGGFRLLHEARRQGARVSPGA